MNCQFKVYTLYTIRHDQTTQLAIVTQSMLTGSLRTIPAREGISTQRRRLAAVWLTAGSAVAYMIGASWLDVVRGGGLPPGGDMIGHAAAAEWIKTLPWWDWRGWSDWFYGGQAIGINYPPLSLNWLRFTHSTHGQMAAVALGLLVLLPWGTLRLARAVGYPARLQRISVGAVLALTAASGAMHWALPGFHAVYTFYSSWPFMLATVVGLFTAAWAARGDRPIKAGIVAGMALLCNPTSIPSLGVASLVLLATSGVTFRQAVRWLITAGVAALAISSWWLVPFLASLSRLVRWEVPLHQFWGFGGVYQILVLTSVGIGAAWASRRGEPSRRLAGVAAAGLAATLLAEWASWLRPERWLTIVLLISTIACAGLATGVSTHLQPRLRPVWKLHVVLGLIVFVVLTFRLEVLVLVVGVFLLPARSWTWTGTLAWSATLLWGGLWGVTNDSSELSTESPFGAVIARTEPGANGLVYADRRTPNWMSELHVCPWGQPWVDTARTGGLIRPLLGLYRETSPSYEFIATDLLIRTGQLREDYPVRPNWFEIWEDVGSPRLDSLAAAKALGARWHASCEEGGNVFVTDLSGVVASGVTVGAHQSEESWHRAAARWWIKILAEPRTEPESWEPVPIRGKDGNLQHPTDQAATGVWMRADGDRLTVGADTAGWAWLRVPWDPYWRSPTGTAVHKGGPGHLVIWAPAGETLLMWQVPTAVDITAAAVTGTAVLTILTMAVRNRCRQDHWLDPDRPRPVGPVRSAIGLYADTVDEWLSAVGRWTRAARRAPGAAAARVRNQCIDRLRSRR